MEITIDLSRLVFLSSNNPAQLIWYIFSHGGWLIFVIGLLILIFYVRLIWQRKKYVKSVEQTLLAIDIPKDNEQSLIAVEQIFASLAGIKSGPNLWEKYWLGKVQLWFSLEIISLEGYIQFLIRTPVIYRDLVESALYAQYPEAEITEVNDYIKLIPDDVHEISSEHNIWATEFTLAKNSAYPIKTYKFFEHQLSQLFIDPMSALLEVMSKLGKGEQLAIQLLIAPVGDHWKDKGHEIVAHLIGEKSDAPKNLGDKIVDSSVKGLEKFSEAVIKLWGDIKDESQEDSAKNYIQYLTPGERFVVERIQAKLAQITFASKFRLYYLAHNEVFSKGKGVNAILGAINQFNTSDLNAFKKNKRTVTDVDYFFVKSRVSKRQRKFVKYFKMRSLMDGATPFMLCTEELATLYHFPTITVKAPLIKKAEAKRAEPPTALPVEFMSGKNFFTPKEEKSAEQPQEIETVGTEPTYKIAESLSGYDFDNNYFEEAFAKDESSIKLRQDTPSSSDSAPEPPDNLPLSR